MLVSNPDYLALLTQLKRSYAALPWYQRFWFSLWSYNLSSALSAIEVDNDENKPTSAQIQALYDASQKAWFFSSIFGLLQQFKEAVNILSFVEESRPFTPPPEDFNCEVGHGLTTKDPVVKESPFARLSGDLDREISDSLTTQELINLVQTSTHHKALFQPILDVRQFLHHVTRGNYAAVEDMLKKAPTLLTKKGSITDCSGRTFSNISGFEYALWALDKHMWARMLNCLPNNEQGKKIKTTLAAQYKSIKDQGIIYSVNGTKIPAPEHHFDFQNTIIKELQTHVEAANAPNPDWDDVDKKWRKGVGSAQKKLPMHVVYEYCSEEPFFPKPTFIGQPTLKKQFYNWMTNLYENWFHQGSKLGSDFAIYKSSAGVGQNGVMLSAVAGANGRYWFGDGAARELDAITALCEVRTKDFNNLEEQLGSRPDDIPDLALQM